MKMLIMIESVSVWGWCLFMPKTTPRRSCLIFSCAHVLRGVAQLYHGCKTVAQSMRRKKFAFATLHYLHFTNQTGLSCAIIIGDVDVFRSFRSEHVACFALMKLRLLFIGWIWVHISRPRSSGFLFHHDRNFD